LTFRAGEFYQKTMDALRNFYEASWALLSPKISFPSFSSISLKERAEKKRKGVTSSGEQITNWVECTLCNKWRKTYDQDFSEVEFVCSLLEGVHCSDPADNEVEEEEEATVRMAVGGVEIENLRNYQIAELDQWKLDKKGTMIKSLQGGLIRCGTMEDIGEVTYRVFPDIDKLYHDLRFLVSLAHPNLVAPLGYSPSFKAIVFSANRRIPLSFFLTEQGSSKDFSFFNFGTALDILKDAWVAIEYLHSRKTSHNYIRPESIFLEVGENFEVLSTLLGDLYFCRHVSFTEVVGNVERAKDADSWRYSCLEKLKPSGFESRERKVYRGLLSNNSSRKWNDFDVQIGSDIYAMGLKHSIFFHSDYFHLSFAIFLAHFYLLVQIVSPARCVMFEFLTSTKIWSRFSKADAVRQVMFSILL
jgi:serine/threonine protein kinase